MENVQAVTQAVTQVTIEPRKTLVQIMSEAAGPERNNGATAASISSRTNGPSWKQPAFNWKAKDKNNELLNFEIEVKIFL